MNCTENNLLPVCWTLTFLNCSCKGKDYIYEKWHIWNIESEPYFTVVYYWFAISINNLYTSPNKEHPFTVFFWHYVREEEKLENTKGVIRNCKSERYIQDKDQKKKDKRTINDQQNITQRTKDGETWTLLKHWVEPRCPRMASSSCSFMSPLLQTGKKSWPSCDYDKRNIFVVFC